MYLRLRIYLGYISAPLLIAFRVLVDIVLILSYPVALSYTHEN